MSNQTMRLLLAMLVLFCAVPLLNGCLSPVVTYADIDVTSTSFKDGEDIPLKYTRMEKGENISPQIEWGVLPVGSVSLVVIVDDPDASDGTWTHWVIYNIPATVTELAEGIVKEPTLANGAKQGKNSWGNIGYDGPEPPSGKHRYNFKVYALDTMLTLSGEVTKDAVMDALTGHILGVGRMMGWHGEEETDETEE